MKKIFYLAMAALPLLGFVACSDDDDDKKPETKASIEIKKDASSDCLGSGLKSTGYADNDTYCDVYADATKGELQIILTNYVANCGVRPYMENHSNGNTIILDVKEKGDELMKCLCTYNDTVVIGGLEKGFYELSINGNIYDLSKAVAQAEIDLTQKDEFKGRIFFEVQPTVDK